MKFFSLSRLAAWYVTALITLASSVVTLSFTITLDPSFGSSGKMTVEFSNVGERHSLARSAFRQQSGRMVLFGNYTIGGVSNYAWAGIDQLGGVDSSFGTNGTILETSSLPVETVQEIKLLPDGKFLRLGMTYETNVPSLVRFGQNGIRDESFVSNIHNNSSHTVYPENFAIRSDGKINVLVRDQTSGGFYLARLNSDGSRDVLFGSNGIQEINLRRLAGAYISDIYVSSDGGILIGGGVTRPVLGPGVDNPTWDTAWVARFDENGFFDRRYGNQGIARLRLEPAFMIRDMIVYSDGSVLLVGDSRTVSNESRALMVRFNSRGRYDVGFGSNGIVTRKINPAPNSNDFPVAAAITKSGEIVLAGTTFENGFGPSYFLVGRFSASGDLVDHTKTQFTNGLSADATDLVYQPDGKVVVAGYARNPIPKANGNLFAIARYVFN